MLPNTPHCKKTTISPTKPKQLIKLTCTNLKRAQPTGLAQTQKIITIKNKYNIKENQSTNIPTQTKDKQIKSKITHFITYKNNIIHPPQEITLVAHTKRSKLKNTANQNTHQIKVRNHNNHYVQKTNHTKHLKRTRPTGLVPNLIKFNNNNIKTKHNEQTHNQPTKHPNHITNLDPKIIKINNKQKRIVYINTPHCKTTNISQLIKLTCTNLKRARPVGLAQTQKIITIKNKYNIKENQSTNIPKPTKDKQIKSKVTHFITHKNNIINPPQEITQVPHTKRSKLTNTVNQNTHQIKVRNYIHKRIKTRPTAPPQKKQIIHKKPHTQ